MTVRVRAFRTLVPVIAAGLCVAYVFWSPGWSSASARSGSLAGLQTAIYDPIDITPANADTALARVAAAGATFVRLEVIWGSVAPGGATKPSGFDAANPDSSGYDWSDTDTLVTKAVADGLTPILDLVGAPAWATGPAGTGEPFVRPSPSEYGQFAQAVATRYDGAHDSLPRATYFQAWNEPNRGDNLAPQRVGTILFTPDWYRQMVNAFARGVHRVHTENVVIAGGLAPYAATTGPGIPPLTFMKQFLCLSTRQIRPRPACLGRADFDVWSMQPYTWGSPVHKATVAGDVALGDLPAMKAVLDQAWTSGRILSSAEPDFWATEFSYDTDPPDTAAVPIAIQTRWTSESLYRMWQAGMSLVTWFMLRDQEPPSQWQSGLWTNGGSNWSNDVKKTTFEAFRFPVVAFPEGSQTRVWARVPPGVSGAVTFKVGSGSSFPTTLGTIVPTDGIATGLYPAQSSSLSVEAVLSTGETSIPFSLTDVPDTEYNPFGN